MFNRSKSLLFAGATRILTLPYANLSQNNVMPAPMAKRRQEIVRRKNEPGYKYFSRLRRNQINLSYKANCNALLAWWADIRGKDVEAVLAYDLIQNMSNWQNHQWRKAGGKRDLDTVKAFAALARPAKQLGGLANV